MNETPQKGDTATGIVVVIVAVILFVGAVTFIYKSCDRLANSEPEPIELSVINNKMDKGSVIQVKYYIKNEYGSDVEFVEWGTVQKSADGTYTVYVKFRYTNELGGKTTEGKMACLDETGHITSLI